MTSKNDTDRASERRIRDFDDLQNEIAGRETGRNQRFTRKDVDESAAMRSRRAMQDAHLSALESLLANDPEYAALYGEVSDVLNRIEATTEAALARAETDLSDATQTLDKTLEDANKLPDGTAAFRDKDGNIRTEDGRLVEDEEADGIAWKDNAPSYEEVSKRKEAMEDVKRRIEELRGYQIDVIGKARDRMNDPDNPPSKEELERIQKELEERAPAEVRSAVAPEVPEVDHEKTASHDIDVFKF